MTETQSLIPAYKIEELILLVRGQRVMLDSDLAAIYGVSTSALNLALKRNASRFPADFAFQLTRQEMTALISQFAISKTGWGGRRQPPWVFTEHGAIMLATVLNSGIAVEASVRVVRAFLQLRGILGSNKQLAVKFAELERRSDANDQSIKVLFDAIRELLKPQPSPEGRRQIGFHVKEQAVRYTISRHERNHA